MITAITPNPALDVTYEVDELLLHRTTRVRAVHERPGGKGVNVARVAAALGRRAEASGFLGGRDGRAVADLLTRIDPGIAQRWVPIDGTTRRTIAVVDAQDTSMLNEPGPAVTAGDWTRQAELLADGSGPVVVSGSMPPGSRPGDLSGVIAAARAAGRPIIVDTSGPLLHAAARAGADLLKPNRDELAAAVTASATGMTAFVDDPDAAVEAAKEYVPDLADAAQAAHAREVAVATGELIRPAADTAVGSLDSDRVGATIDFLGDHGLLGDRMPQASEVCVPLGQ